MSMSGKTARARGLRLSHGCGRWSKSAVAAAAAAAVAGQPAWAGLTHRYSFNDAPGSTTALDSVGGANGVVVDSTTIGNPLVAIPPTFDGSRFNFNNLVNSTTISLNNYIDLPNNIAKTTNVTVEGWATWGGPAGTNWQRIFDFGTNTGGEEQPGNTTTTGFGGTDYFFVAPRADRSGGAFGSEIHNAAGASNSADQSGVDFGVGTQHHFALTIKGGAGGSLTLYKDGVQVGASGTTLDPATLTQVNMWLGRSNYAGDPFFNGSLNEFRIYDTALTNVQVAASYGAGPDNLPAAPTSQTWAVAGPADYNTGSNWSNGIVPNAGDTAVFANGGTATVAGPTNPVVLQMQNGTVAVTGGTTYTPVSIDLAPASVAGRTAALSATGGSTIQVAALTLDGAATTTGTSAKR
ncbi:MAG: hypothetical protein JWO31_263, partial [Phycisphaerales bacterium]|nr:hypothetical protein [Phycisphaerales bacterium]